MGSCKERALLLRGRAITSGRLRGDWRSMLRTTLGVLVMAGLLLVSASPASLPEARAEEVRHASGQPAPGFAEIVAVVEGALETQDQAQEPTPEDTAELPSETQEPTPEDTPATPGETEEPTPEDTPVVPGETEEPVPGDTPTGVPGTPEGTAEPEPSQTVQPPTETIEPTPGKPTDEATPAPEETDAPAPTEPAATVSATAVPSPTPTVSSRLEDWLSGSVRFGSEEAEPLPEPIQIATSEWLRIALALVVVALVAFLGGRLLHQLLRWVIRRRKLEVDATRLDRVKPLLSWWLAAIGFHIAVIWVDFENEPARELFGDLAFLAYLWVATLTVWRFLDRAIDLYAERVPDEEQAALVQKLRPILRRWGRALILIVSTLIALGRLDVGFSAPTILVLLIGLGIVFAARDTIQDITTGFFILLDQPFRIGDRIEAQGVDTWAEVVNIGLRSSVLRTRHNVEVIVPNSTIGKGQVINYSYPDSRYRLQTHVGIAFGTDVEHARRVLIDAVRRADYVLPDEPVEALYVEVGDSAMVFRVRWWIDFYRDWERSFDQVHTALHIALNEAGIESPYPIQSLNVEVDDQTLAEVWQAWQGEIETGLTE